jgi:general secretion pathway protein A
MYTHYFELREKPFNVTPDPRFFYMNPVYREAYASLQTGIQERKGFVVMTGEVGTGKTTLLRLLMKNLEANVRFAYYYHTTLSFEELLIYTCEELGLTVPKGGRLRKIQTLNEFLIEQLRCGGTAALLIDEAQHLSEHVLESLRLLSNLETGTEKLLQIVLVGQPELEAKLAQPSLRQLKQRVAVACSLDRLKDREIKAYIQFRLESVGCKRKDLFHPAAIERIAIYSSGVPRLINIICDNALTIAYASSERRVSREMIEEVATDLRLSQAGPALAPTVVTSQAAPVAPALAPVAELVPAAAPVPTVAEEPVARPPAPSYTTEPYVAAPVQRRARRLPRWMVAAAALVVAGGVAIWQADQLAGVGAVAWQRATTASALTATVATAVWDTAKSQMENLTAKPTRPVATLSAPPVLESSEPPRKAPAAPDSVVDAVATQRAATPPPAKGSYEDERRLPETVPVSLPPRQGAVVLQRGGTVSSLAYSAYGRYDMLAIDLIKELNPHIEDLDRIRPGARLALPPLTAETLIRSQAEGGYRIVLASFLSPVAAEKLSEQVKRRGFVPRITHRQVARRLTLYRVEIADVTSRHAAEQAWKVAVANCLVFIEATPCGGTRREDKP